MIDIVIPLGRGSKHQNIELMYCLRSIEKFLRGYRDIYIVTHKPLKWLTGVKYIFVEDEMGGTRRERNIYRKVKAACEHPDVSEHFLFMNDDHYFIDHYEAMGFPYKYSGVLNGLLKGRHENDKYNYTINNTIKAIGNQKNFDIHCPIVYNKQLFTIILGKLDWNTRFGFCIKSSYCHGAGIAGTKNYKGDIKLRKAGIYIDYAFAVKDNGWFSISDATFDGDMKLFLKALYGEKSSYEAE